MKNPAREKFLPMLSPYVDGELSPEDRQLLEQHLANNKESAGQVADLRAADALMRHALEMQADQVDWKAFTEDVMGRVAKEKLPLGDRLRIWFSEMFTYQRGPLMVGFAAAAVAVLVAVPLTLKFGAPDGYGANQVRVQSASVGDDSPYKPVVMETESGDAIIWMVESNPDGGKKKKDGEHSEETLVEEPKAEDL
ncbi:MAG TPA: zf-HC2 domain-containing protein [Archangium sp.]